jgi:hypothetical protein
MPRVSRSVSQRYASASKKKGKRRGEARADTLPPVVPQAPVELPGGLASPAPLEPPPAPVAPPRPARAVARSEARRLTQGEIRHATRRLTAAPITDYSYVAGDLRRIGIVTGGLLALLFALTLLPWLH